MRLGRQKKTHRQQALIVRIYIMGIPISLATSQVYPIVPSAIIQVTGLRESELSLPEVNRSLKRILLLVFKDSNTSIKRSMERGWSSGRPSGMVSRWKPG